MKRLFFFLVSALLTLCAFAQEFFYDGIKYQILDKGNKTCYLRDCHSDREGNLVIPSSVIYEGVNYSVTTIGSSAFYGCNRLKSVELPNSVINVRNIAFTGAGSLTDIIVQEGNPKYASKNGVLFNKDFTSLVAYPNGKAGAYKIPETVTTIKNWAFDSCNKLTSVEIPNSVTSIEEAAFRKCKSLTNITVQKENPSYVSQDGVLFNHDLTSLVSYPAGKNGGYKIPDSVTTIEADAFSGCTGLSSIEIPGSVVSILHGAFYGCTGLSSVEIPNSVKNIGYSAFDSCSAIESVKLSDSVKEIGISAFSDCIRLKSIKIPDSVSTIRVSTFYGCSGLTAVEIPSSVTIIETNAFNGCSALTSIDIPGSVADIYDLAFSRCSSIKSINIPRSVTFIGIGAFGWCTSVTDITVEDGNKNFTSENGVLFNKDLTTLIAYPCGKAGAYRIPDSVTKIEDWAFGACNGLTSVKITNPMIVIGEGAFTDCSSLTDIDVENGNKNYTSDNGVLFNKDLTTLIAYPAGKAGAYRIPGSVTKIEDFAFNSCDGLTNVEIPASVNSIGFDAFTGSPSLTDIVVENGNKNYASSNGVLFNKDLTTLVTYPAGKAGAYKIPDSVTAIEMDAFSGCRRLTSIEIPGTRISMSGMVFNECDSIEKVYYNSIDPTSEGPILFSEKCYADATLYLPEATINNISGIEPWCKFQNIRSYNFNNGK